MQKWIRERKVYGFQVLPVIIGRNIFFIGSVRLTWAMICSPLLYTLVDKTSTTFILSET